MIHWLIQSASTHPELSRAVPPSGLLCAAEHQQFDAFKVEKRRFDWLLGRWTAKHLIRLMVEQHYERRFALHQLCIENDTDGAPVAKIPGVHDLSLTISHSGDFAVAAAIFEPAYPIGVDLELISERSDAFIHDYFTEAEIALVQAARPELTAAMMTAIWSAKESALKSLRLGLTVDTYAAVCLIEPPNELPVNWTPFPLHLDLQLLRARSLDAAHAAYHVPALKGWWRTFNGYVLTLVVLDGSVTIKQEMLDD